MYTPLSYHDVFPADPSSYQNVDAILYQGKTVYATRQENGKYQIDQLLSSDPNDYLNDDFLPGRIIS
ncbi:hypothetical conserved protein [Oceanobacillus iheyensis HTE831]|uniref:Hypothetical conserved protein n=1 Tax=Oceanobacillus iheyensis (strain DSM 14371 / CIP 107618 / JCM 11309 / KCTC 3954 / HTE831) TaxID=221109 RepID=Q8EQS8_OCEIH|nr:hypothetical conserved protein [Oceanobacillus iheyensis HTE831]